MFLQRNGDKVKDQSGREEIGRMLIARMARMSDLELQSLLVQAEALIAMRHSGDVPVSLGANVVPLSISDVEVA